MELKATWLLVVRERTDDVDGEVVAAFQVSELVSHALPQEIIKQLEAIGEAAFACEWDGDVPDMVGPCSLFDGIDDDTPLIERLKWDADKVCWTKAV